MKKALELLFIIVILLLLTFRFYNPFSDLRISGFEFSYLINSGVVAADMFYETGVIPLWNPFIGQGEPLVENPFSFVLNPFMTLPIFWLGAIQGTKLAILIHIMLMATGGWALANTLGLKVPSRILLGLLLGASGSLTAAIGDGFYQMGLSQTYVPWVLVGLLHTIWSDKRWPVGLLVIASTLLVFAGTYWYVLPTAIAAGVITLFYVRDRQAVQRLALALVFTVGLCSVRILPQLVHHHLVDHPRANLRDAGMQNFLDVFKLHFVQMDTAEFTFYAVHYHYILPAAAAVTLAALWLIRRVRSGRPVKRSIGGPAMILILLFTVWAQEGTPVFVWLYETIPLLSQWRLPGRMLAASSLWVAVLAAVWLDDLMQWTNRRQAIIAGLALIVCTIAVVDVLQNWDRRAETRPNFSEARLPLFYLRSQHPGEVISVLTRGFHDYMAFYETRIRAAFGNPDYRPLPEMITLGDRADLNTPPEYAVDFDQEFAPILEEIGYTYLLSTSVGRDFYSIWRHPGTLPYAFVTGEHLLRRPGYVLPPAQADPVQHITHHIDQIHLTVQSQRTEPVLVVREVAYPGWQVTVDGERAQLESVGGRIGVRLPQQSVQVVFQYRPRWYFIGSAIHLVTAVALIVYLAGAILRRMRIQTGEQGDGRKHQL